MTKFKTFFALGLLSCGLCLLSSGCAGLDPALPGQTKPAPFLAFQSGNAYLLGHAVRSNQVYTAALDATRIGVGLLETSDPSVTNYLGDAQLTFNYFAGNGTFSEAALQTALAPAGLDNSSALLVQAAASTILSLSAQWISPLVNKDTNSAPYLKAALHGVADGL